MSGDLATDLATDLAVDLATDLAGGSLYPQTVADLLDWWDAHTDYVQLSTADVDQWVGRHAAKVLSEGATSLKPDWDGADSDFNGQGSIEFDATDDQLTSAIPYADTNFLHDGSGATAFFCVRHTGSGPPTTAELLQTSSSASASNTGLRIAIRPGGSDIRVQIANGSGTWWYNLTTSGSLLPTGTRWFAVAWDATSLNVYSSGGLSETGTTPTGSGSGSDGTVPLAMGSIAAVNAKISDMLLYTAKLDETTCRALGAYFAGTKGVTT